MVKIPQGAPVFLFVREPIERQNGFWQYFYNGVTVTVNEKRTMFNASKLTKQICLRRKRSRPSECTKSYNHFSTNQDIERILKIRPEWHCVIEGVGKEFNGHYLSWHLFERYLECCDSVKSIFWRTGDPEWRSYGDDGYIYLVQTAEHLSRDETKTIYKVGRTGDLDDRFRSYGGEKCKVFRTFAVDNMYQAERKLLDRFEEEFTKAKCSENEDGVEYFYCDDDETAMNAFDEVVEMIQDEINDENDE